MEGLARCTLFSGLPDKEFKAIEKEFKEVTHEAGSHVVDEGRGGVSFMVIVDGEAEVRLHDGRTRQLRPGDFFGEMALLDKGGRSATVVASTDLKLAALPEWSFKDFLVTHPEVAYRMLEQLSRRIRESEKT